MVFRGGVQKNGKKKHENMREVKHVNDFHFRQMSCNFLKTVCKIQQVLTSFCGIHLCIMQAVKNAQQFNDEDITIYSNYIELASPVT